MWQYEQPLGGGGGGISNVVEDTSPQLGGDLDVNGQSIVSTSDGDIPIAPNGTGSVVLDGLKWPQADSTGGFFLSTDGVGQLSFVSGDLVEDTSPQLGGNLDVNGQSLVSTSDGDIAITPDGTGSVVLDGLKWPQADGAAGSFLTTDSAGQLSFVSGAQVVRTNDNAGTLVIGQPVYTKSNGNADEAQADAAATTVITGLVSSESIATTASGNIQVDGPLTATTGQWDAVTGKSGGLTVNANYYLDPLTAGQLTDTAPTDTGDYVAPIGLALSTTELCIRITPTVLL